MNRERRKSIQAEIETLVTLKGEAEALAAALKEKFQERKEALEEIRDAEQEYFDNMPENMQQSERAQAAENAVNELEYAIDELDTLAESILENIDDIDTITGYLENAKE